MWCSILAMLACKLPPVCYAQLCMSVWWAHFCCLSTVLVAGDMRQISGYWHCAPNGCPPHCSIYCPHWIIVVIQDGHANKCPRHRWPIQHHVPRQRSVLSSKVVANSNLLMPCLLTQSIPLCRFADKAEREAKDTGKEAKGQARRRGFLWSGTACHGRDFQMLSKLNACYFDNMHWWTACNWNAADRIFAIAQCSLSCQCCTSCVTVCCQAGVFTGQHLLANLACFIETFEFDQDSGSCQISINPGHFPFCCTCISIQHWYLGLSWPLVYAIVSMATQHDQCFEVSPLHCHILHALPRL